MTTTSVTADFPLQEFTSWQHIRRPNIIQVLKLQRDINACASSVRSSAGGGNHGCLGQVMATADYLDLTGQAYITPQHPGAFAPEGLRITAVQQITLHEAHKTQVEQARRARELENALKRMIIEAVPSRYLSYLRDPTTGSYDGQSVRQIMAHLKGTVATLTDDELRDEHDRIATMNFDPDGMEVSEVMADIKFLAKLAEVIDNPFSDAQLMRLALKVFTNCGYFTQGLRSWKARPAEERTFDHMHQHFVQEHIMLHELHPQGIGAVVGHQANVLKECTDTMINQQQQYFDAKTQELEAKSQQLEAKSNQLTELMLALRQEVIANASSSSDNDDKPKR